MTRVEGNIVNSIDVYTFHICTFIINAIIAHNMFIIHLLVKYQQMYYKPSAYAYPSRLFQNILAHNAEIYFTSNPL